MQDVAYSLDLASIEHVCALSYRQKASVGCYKWLNSVLRDTGIRLTLGYAGLGGNGGFMVRQVRPECLDRVVVGRFLNPKCVIEFS